MLRKSLLLAAVASASAFVATPASLGARGMPAVSSARPLSLRGGAVKMVCDPNPVEFQSNFHASVLPV